MDEKFLSASSGSPAHTLKLQREQGLDANRGGHERIMRATTT
jgi:hypothetical protein